MGCSRFTEVSRRNLSLYQYTKGYRQHQYLTEAHRDYDYGEIRLLSIIGDNDD